MGQLPLSRHNRACVEYGALRAKQVLGLPDQPTDWARQRRHHVRLFDYRLAEGTVNFLLDSRASPAIEYGDRHIIEFHVDKIERAFHR